MAGIPAELLEFSGNIFTAVIGPESHHEIPPELLGTFVFAVVLHIDEKLLECQYNVSFALYKVDIPGFREIVHK